MTSDDLRIAANWARKVDAYVRITPARADALADLIDAARVFDFECSCPNCVPLRAALAALDRDA